MLILAFLHSIINSRTLHCAFFFLGMLRRVVNSSRSHSVIRIYHLCLAIIKHLFLFIACEPVCDLHLDMLNDVDTFI